MNATRRGGVQRLQIVLAALLLAGIVAIGLSLRPRRTGEDLPPPAALPPGRAARTGELEWVGYREGRESFRVVAQEMTGDQREQLRLRGVEMTFGYAAEGESGRSTVTSDHCRYIPTLQKATFRGNVRVSTEDGFELLTDVLEYHGRREVASSDAPVRFRRGRMRGSATGFRYNAKKGRVKLVADVAVWVGRAGEPETHIQAGRGEIERRKEELRFFDQVRVTRGTDTLTSRTLLAHYSRQAGGSLRRVIADEGATLELTGPGEGGLGTAAGARVGTRVLKGSRIDIWFRPGGSLEEVVAGPGASLVVSPGPDSRPERHVLRARVLTFRMDAAGRLREVRGQKKSVLRMEPLEQGSAPSQTMRCRKFLARLDPRSGEFEVINFRRDVRFERDGRKATAGRARYRGGTGRLVLWNGPELVDDVRGSRLRAARINLDTRKGDVRAERNVVHTLSRTSDPSPGLFSGDEGMLLVSSDSFEHVESSHTTRYLGRALLRSGEEEVRADQIELVQELSGGLRLTATGQVHSRLRPTAAEADSEPPPAIEARSEEMVFNENARRLVYTGNTVLRQGELTIHSPRAEVFLGAERGRVERVVAGEPVEVTSAERRAEGTRAIYLPEARQLRIEGSPVRLSRPGQEVRGPALILHMRDGRVQVEGQDKSRTETIFRRLSPKP